MQVYDSIDLETCKVQDKKTTYTYTAGTLAGGLVEEYKLKKDLKLLLLAHNITQSVISSLTMKFVAFGSFSKRHIKDPNLAVITQVQFNCT